MADADPDSDLAPRRRRLPDVSLPPLGGGEGVPLRARRQGTVLVLLGDRSDEGDRAYLARLADAAESLAGWDGRVLVVAPGEGAARHGSPFPVLGDPGGTVAAAAGVSPPALVVADQWGEVHVAAPAAGGWLDVREVEAWLRYVAIRCAG